MISKGIFYVSFQELLHGGHVCVCKRGQSVPAANLTCRISYFKTRNQNLGFCSQLGQRVVSWLLASKLLSLLPQFPTWMWWVILLSITGMLWRCITNVHGAAWDHGRCYRSAKHTIVYLFLHLTMPEHSSTLINWRATSLKKRNRDSLFHEHTALRGIHACMLC